MKNATGPAPTSVVDWLAPGRVQPYLDAAGGDRGRASTPYAWSAELASECFNALHLVEVAVRHTIDATLRHHFDEPRRGLPWFLLPLPVESKSRALDRRDEAVQAVRLRLRGERTERETRDQVVAGLSFGFWAALLHGDYEPLWRVALHRAFPHSSGQRKDVVAVVEPLRVFRNRVAHHDSLLQQDVQLRLDQMRQVLAWIDPQAASAFNSWERVSDVLARRPDVVLDTAVVAADKAWLLYRAVHAYVCQPGRAFRPVRHLAFYADREIKPEVPRVHSRRDHVDWSPAKARSLSGSPHPEDRRLAAVIRASREQGWSEGRYQVFSLSAPGDDGHDTLPSPVPHLARGRGSAFTQRQRYVSLADPRSATSTADL